MRQIVLDTETTGLEHSAGHRIIEIGCIEIIDRKITGNRFHVYLNPERDIDAGAVEVHGLSRDFLADKPKFGSIADDFLTFLAGAELIIHNASFDEGFINHELRLLAAGHSEIADYCKIVDTLAMAKKMYPGQRNNLDALCRRHGIDNSRRDLHGALLDAELLAEVYLAMTGGQTRLTLEFEAEVPAVKVETGTETSVSLLLSHNRKPLKIQRSSLEEENAHSARLAEIARYASGCCLWLRMP
jgi:DNA polymerase-3 subunit epsilon